MRYSGLSVSTQLRRNAFVPSIVPLARGEDEIKREKEEEGRGWRRRRF